MIILLQLVLFCLLFIGMVKLAARDSGRNCLYFYRFDAMHPVKRSAMMKKLHGGDKE